MTFADACSAEDVGKGKKIGGLPKLVPRFTKTFSSGKPGLGYSVSPSEPPSEENSSLYHGSGAKALFHQGKELVLME